MPSTDRAATAADPQLPAWRLFIENAARIQTELDRRLRADALRLADYHLLVLLSEAPGRRLRMTELSAAMVFSASRLSYQVSALERRGWVRRENAAEDRRGSYAVLTDDGMRAFRAVARTHRSDVDDLFFSALTGDDVDALARLMHRLSHHLDSQEHP